MLDKAFQTHLVAVLLRSPQHAKAIAHSLDPSMIKNAALADVADVAARHVRDYGVPPTKFVLRHECGAKALTSPVVQRAFKVSIGDAGYVSSKFGEYARQHAVERAVIRCAEDIKNKRLDGIVDAMRKACATGADSSDLGTQLREYKKRAKWYSSDARRYTCVPTGFAQLDEVMHGGLGAGELGLALGDSKIGKSFLATNFGVNALVDTAAMNRDGYDERGLKVIHHTCELSEKKTYQRYDKIMAGKNADLLGKSTARFMRKLKSKVGMLVHPESNLIVKGWPNQTLKPSMIEAHADMVQMQLGWRPDLVIVDYIGEMIPEHSRGELRFDLSSITSDLRRIAIERMWACWSPFQANKLVSKKKVTQASDAAEDYGVIRIADVVLSLNATEEEYNEGVMRIYLAAMRDARGHVTIDCEFDFDVGYIRAVDRKDPHKIIKADSSDKIDKHLERAEKINRSKKFSRVDEKE